MGKAALWVQEACKPDFIDINLGCPVKKVTQKGGGAALLKDLPRLRKLLSCVRSVLKIPLTIKIRTGWSQRNAHEVCQLAFDEGVTWVTIHGRTQVQGYSGQADWDYIHSVAQKAALPIIGNGDIHTPNEALEYYKKTACAGIMVGRAALRNPSIFQQMRVLSQGGQNPDRLASAHLFCRLQNHLLQHMSDRSACLQLKKFASWFSTGYPGATSFRREVFQQPNLASVVPKGHRVFSKNTMPSRSKVGRKLDEPRPWLITQALDSPVLLSNRKSSGWV